MEVDLVAIFAVIVRLVAGVLIGMFFTFHKKFWEGYEVSPTTYMYSYNIIMYSSANVRKEESSSGWKTLFRATCIILKDEVDQSHQLAVRTTIMLSLMQIRR